MNTKNRSKLTLVFGSALTAAVLLSPTGCSKAEKQQAAITVRKAASKEQSGFLSDYSRLNPNPRLDKSVLTYVNPDLTKNLHGYIGVIVEPVQVYLAADADPSTISTPNAERAALYFRSSLIGAVQDAFPVTNEPGPLVLRLRAAIVGVDTGADVAAEEGQAAGKAVNIGKAIIEVELVDSVSGEVIAAAQDREAAGSGEIGPGQLSREERFQMARIAMDNWSKRVREFLNAAHEFSPEDAAKADRAYRPYGAE